MRGCGLENDLTVLAGGTGSDNARSPLCFAKPYINVVNWMGLLYNVSATMHLTNNHFYEVRF